MKKMIAFLLAISIIAGFAACGKKEDAPEKDSVNAAIATTVPESAENDNKTVTTKETDWVIVTSPSEATADNSNAGITGATAQTLLPTASVDTEATTVTKETDVTAATKATEATELNPSASPFYGKTIEIYGLGSEHAYTDYSQYDETYAWMMRAALAEWAEMNGVTLLFSGDYDQTEILSAISAGDHPDIVFHTEKFPAVANANIITSFTDAEYKKLAEICGSGYLDMLNYKTKSHGFVLPWAGNTMCYYNKTLFETYNVKTPKEYFLEGEWTWESFQKCMEEMTKDTDGDGENDIYGLPGDSLTWCRMVNPVKTDDSGMLINTIDDPMIQDFFQFKYDVFTQIKCAAPGKNEIQTNITSPVFAMQLSECEVYNIDHLYQTLPNGNVLEVVPVPAYKDSNLLQWTQACVSLAATCDERAAAVDMLSYLLKSGMKYMSDYSLGAVKCDYEGVQGHGSLAAAFVEAFTKLCEKRAGSIKKIDGYDEELIAKIYETFQNAEWYTYQTYPGVKLLTSYSEITQMRPESAIPVIKPKYEAEIKKYNDMYNNES